MLDMNEYQTIRSMHELGASIKLIAREMQLSRNTVRKYLRSDSPPEPPGPSVHDPTADVLDNQIKKLVARGFVGSYILNELTKLGLACTKATFYRRLERCRAQVRIPEIIQRFETAPAEQAQYDWSEHVIPGTCAPVKIYVSCLILGYSRFRHYHASLDITQPSIFTALETGFAAFQGVPKEVLFDNPRALVVHSRPHLAWNDALLALARHYGFLPRACWPYRAQTKGKVENPFRYLKAHFIAGLVWNGLEDFIARLRTFEQAVNRRPHGTTGTPPEKLFAAEQPRLRALPEHPFISPTCDIRHVGQDCLIPFDKRRYSVPWQYAGGEVWVKVAGACLEIYSQAGRLLARHAIEQGPRRVIIDNRHYTGLHEHKLQKSVLVETFKARFPAAELFLTKLLAQYKFGATLQLRRILKLADGYAPAAMNQAFEQALAHNTFSANFVRGILEQRCEPDQHIVSTGSYQSRLSGFDPRPDLNRYQELINESLVRQVSNE